MDYISVRYLLIIILTMRTNSTSPFRSGVYSGEDSMPHYARSLEQEINILSQENATLRSKVKKVNELQEKIDLVLKHNTNLLNENEQLSKLINQRKAENELLKNKFDAFAVQSSASNDIENKRLKIQIDKLKSEIIELQQMKNIQLGELKAQMTQQIQLIKRANINALEAADVDNRKLKDACDSKEYEISELAIKLNRMAKDYDFEVIKLKQEKDRLRKEIEIQQEEHRRDVANLKAKFQGSMHHEIQNLKKVHLNEADQLQFQNSKLKDMVAMKSVEIQQILGKNLKMKQNYEEEVILLKRENEALKDKLVESQRMSQLEIANLRQKFENMRQSQISLLKSAHINQTEILTNQIKTLEDMVATKNLQIEGYVKQRNEARIFLDSETKKFKAKLEASTLDNKEAEHLYQINLSRLQKEIKAKDEENRTLDAAFSAQVATLKDQLNKYKDLLESKTRELEKQQGQTLSNEKALKKRIKDLEHQLSESHHQHEKSKGQSSIELSDVKKLNQSKVGQLNQQIRSLEEQGQQKDSIISTLKKTIQLKDGQLDTQAKNAASLERMIAKTKKQLQETKQRGINKQAEYNRITKEQRERMTSNFEFQLSNVRNEFNNEISGLKLQIADLKKQIKLKTAKLDELRKMYDNLLKQTQKVLRAEANRKELDIKEPGWLPDTIATKGLFDVFLKNKVIEWCDV